MFMIPRFTLLLLFDSQSIPHIRLREMSVEDDTPTDSGDSSGLSPDVVRIIVWVKSVLASWKHNVELDVSHGISNGTEEMSLYRGTKTSLRPFIEVLKDDQVATDITLKIREMIKLCDSGKHDKAEEIPQALAIGNRSWHITSTQRVASDGTHQDRMSSSLHCLDSDSVRRYCVGLKTLIGRHKESCKKQLDGYANSATGSVV